MPIILAVATVIALCVATRKPPAPPIEPVFRPVYEEVAPSTIHKEPEEYPVWK